MLADTAAEAVDARTVHFLLTDAMKHLKEGRKMEEEEERRWLAQVKAMTELSRQLPRKRKRKKRKKRKLPRAPLRDVPVLFNDKFQQFFEFFVPLVQFLDRNGGHSCCAAETRSHSFLHIPGAVLGQGRCARVAQRQGYGQTVQNAVLVPKLQFFEGRRHPFRAAESVSHGLVWSEDHRGSSVAVRCQVVDALIAHVVLDMPVVVQRQVLMVQMTSGLSPFSALSLVRQRIHALRQSTELFEVAHIFSTPWFYSGYMLGVSLRGLLASTLQKLWILRSCSSSKVVDILVFTQMLFPVVLIVQKTIKIHQLLVDMMADVLFVLVVQVLTCRLWVGQSSSHSS